MRSLSLLSFGFCLLFAASTSAQTSSADTEARLLFQAGQVAFDEGEYGRALDAFERSYALSHRSELLYNIGVTAEHLRHDERALEAFRTYLTDAPRGQHRRQVEARIRILEASLATRTSTDGSAPLDAPPAASTSSSQASTNAAAPAAPSPSDAARTAATTPAAATPPASTTRSGHPGLGLFVATGVAALATGGAAAYWANRGSALSECRDAAQNGRSCTNESALETQRSVGMALTIVSAVAVPSFLVGALVKRKHARREGTALACAPGVFGLACAGSF